MFPTILGIVTSGQLPHWIHPEAMSCSDDSYEPSSSGEGDTDYLEAHANWLLLVTGLAILIVVSLAFLT